MSSAVIKNNNKIFHGGGEAARIRLNGMFRGPDRMGSKLESSNLVMFKLSNVIYKQLQKMAGGGVS